MIRNGSGSAEAEVKIESGDKKFGSDVGAISEWGWEIPHSGNSSGRNKNAARFWRLEGGFKIAENSKRPALISFDS